MGTAADPRPRRERGAWLREPLRFTPPRWSIIAWAAVLVVLGIDEQLARSSSSEDLLSRLAVISCYIAAALFPLCPRAALIGGLGGILLISATLPVAASIAVPLFALAFGVALLGRAELLICLMAGVVLWAAIIGADATAGEKVTEFWRGLLVVAPFLVLGHLIQMLLRGLADRARMRRIREETARIRHRERQALAQDLHDALAHELTLMSVQAMTYRRTQGQDPDAVIHALETGARSSLVELRSLMSLLAEELPEDSPGDALPASLPDEGARTHPLGRIRAVVDHLRSSLRAAGFDTDAEVAVDESAEIPRPHVSAVVRVLQEAATNIAKHAAPGSGCALRVTSSCTQLELEVTNEICAVSPTAQQDIVSRGTGQGLVGMRERVDLAGGSLTAGADDDIWRVYAVFPLHPGAAERTEPEASSVG